MTIDDGSELDSRQPMSGPATARAIHAALVSSHEWWSAVVSVVIPTLDDTEGGYALADRRTMRKPYSTSSASVLAKYRKTGEVVYEVGRPINDTRWVLLWSVNKGWADVDVDWAAIAREIAVRTGPWVGVLADAVADCLGVERRLVVAIPLST